MTAPALTRRALRRAPETPYVGLNPFSQADAEFFFGRETERRIIAANLTASRLTLVYGPSGVGKSSLLRAGVVNDLELAVEDAVDQRRFPDAIPIVFGTWRDEPLAGLAEAIQTTVSKMLGSLAPGPVEPRGRLDELLAAWNERLDEAAANLDRETGIRQPEHVDLLIVLDQFEEYFVYHPDVEGEGTFADELPRAVNARGLRANFLISLREDAYTLLDRFEEEIPNLFGNNIRIDHLDRKAAEAAIREPVHRYAEQYPAEDAPRDVEQSLVDAVIKDVKAGKVVLGQVGGGGVESEESEETEADVRVETPFLQLVLERLWRQEQAEGSNLLRLKTLQRLGGAAAIVREHLEQAVAGLDEDAQEIAAHVFKRLVTPSGSKIAYLPSDVAKLEEIALDRLAEVLRELADSRILRAVAPPRGEDEQRYEIFHDVLGPAVLAWSARWLQAREHAEAEKQLQADLERQAVEKRAAELQAAQERQAARRFRSVAFAAGILTLIVGAVGIMAFLQKREADRAKGRAEASELVTRATSALATDPAKALDKAERAVRKALRAHVKPTPAAVDALRRAVRSSYLAARLEGESGAIHASAFTPDGRRVVTVDDHGVDVWRAGFATRLFRLPSDPPITVAGISPDGRTVVTGDAAGRTVAWRLTKRGGVFDVLRAPRAALVRIVFSRDGQRFLTAGADGQIRIWPVERATQPVLLTGRDTGVRSCLGTPTAATFSPDDRFVVAACAQRRSNRGFSGLSFSETPTLRGTVGVWGARSGKLRHLLRESQPVRSAAFSADGNLLLTGTREGRIRVWNVRTGSRIRQKSTGAAVTSIAFNRRTDGGMRVVTGDAQGKAELWQPRTGKVQGVLRGHSDTISSISFSRDGHWIVTASGDQTARVWNAETGSLVGMLLGNRDWVSSASFSPDGQRILTSGDDGTARVWRFPTQMPDRLIPARTGFLYDAAFSRDGRRILLVGYDGATVVDADYPNRPGRTFDKKHGAPFAALSGDGTRVFTASPDHVASWSIGGGKLASRRLTVEVRPVASASGRLIALVTPRGLRVWDTSGPKGLTLEAPLDGGRDTRRLAFSEDGRYLAASNAVGNVSVWNVETKRLVSRIQHAGLSAIALSPDGQELVGARGVGGATQSVQATGSGATATVWSTHGSQLRFVVRGHGLVSLVRFSPKGDLILTAGEENTARIWNATRGTAVATLRGHTKPITDAEFSPDGRFVATTSTDGTVRIWVARTGDAFDELGRGQTRRPQHAVFNRVQRRLLVTDEDGTAAIYSCHICGDVHDLLDLAAKRKPRPRR